MLDVTGLISAISFAKSRIDAHAVGTPARVNVGTRNADTSRHSSNFLKQPFFWRLHRSANGEGRSSDLFETSGCVLMQQAGDQRLIRQTLG